MFASKHISRCIFAVLLLTSLAQAADVAVLRNGFSIRHNSREVIGTMTRLTMDGGYIDVPSDQIERFEHDDTPAPAASSAKAAPAGPVKVPELVSQASDRHGVDPDLIASVVRAESGGKATALSRKGAQGLMQLMPGTAAKLGVNNAFDPHQNVDGGTRYLRELLDRYNGDIVKALAAYNAGPGRVDSARGVPHIAETRQYVAAIVRDFNRKKLAQQAAAKKLAGTRPKSSQPQRAAVRASKGATTTAALSD